MLSRGNEISIATGYRLKDREVGFDSRYSQQFSLLYIGHTASGAHPASCPEGVKWQGHEVDHASKKYWGRDNVDSYIHSHIVFMA
jgi:hypothetical protein